MALLPPLRAPRRPDETVVGIPPVGATPVRLGLVVALTTLVLDQVTKSLAVRLLVPNRLVEVVPEWVPYFREGWGWQLVHNPDGALGFNPEGVLGRALGQAIGSLLGEWFFVLVTVLVAVLVARNLPRATRLRSGVAYGLLLGGALGNGLDRLLRPPGVPSGQVVDFIAVRVPEFLPLAPDLARFNGADIAILTGFVLLLRSLGDEHGAHADHGAHRHHGDHEEHRAQGGVS